MNIANFLDGTGTRHYRRGLTLPRASALGVAVALIALSLLFLLDMHALGQTKRQPTPRTPQDAHTWHREVIKDEIDGDGVAYYLSTLEEKNVWLIVVCPRAKAAFASLQFRFRLYGAATSTLKYKSADGEVTEAEFPLTDPGDAMVVGNIQKFKPLVGSTLRVEDSGGNLHTYHLPEAGTVPFDKGCTDERH